MSVLCLNCLKGAVMYHVEALLFAAGLLWPGIQHTEYQTRP